MQKNERTGKFQKKAWGEFIALEVTLSRTESTEVTGLTKWTTSYVKLLSGKR
jgi:hypothetical protein